MSNNRSSMSPEFYTMNGGDGPYSYSNNSRPQRLCIEISKPIIDEAIMNDLDLRSFSLSSNPISIVDLGCSTGPNTFMAVQNILDSIKQKYKSHIPDCTSPEFMVYFNDHSSNDFNTLFASLPPNRQYFVAAVPGSFHGRLFPESSVHFFHSSNAIHWLSKAPEELVDSKSLAWNKGRVHYTNAAKEVCDAYAAQFGKDMEKFLDARGKEIVVGGLMVLTVSGIPNGIRLSLQNPVGLMYHLLGASLMDLVKKEVINEEQAESFNMPIYVVNPEVLREAVERNGNFRVVKMEMIESILKTNYGDEITNLNWWIGTLRSVHEDVITKHFGSGIMDILCQQFTANALEITKNFNWDELKGHQLVVILKRYK
ncbi:loganic acid O-methyltransferase-like [Mangifera indica]|uniref:loganic acid O-methyltransferase-like n=1 Tax=Mangifera indica TaxID=29780 RepID=UPI001CFA070A|nr:loganic acid O-methyltransferase-like [Mangifera indica]